MAKTARNSEPKRPMQMSKTAHSYIQKRHGLTAQILRGISVLSVIVSEIYFWFRRQRWSLMQCKKALRHFFLHLSVVETPV